MSQSNHGNVQNNTLLQEYAHKHHLGQNRKYSFHDKALSNELSEYSNISPSKLVDKDQERKHTGDIDKIKDLLIDRVTIKKYRCPNEDCRKTFDEPRDLFAHTAWHVSTSLYVIG